MISPLMGSLLAIATALMPPVCTCGYSIANGKIIMFSMALYLFLMNAYFIYLSATIVLGILKFQRQKNSVKKNGKRMKKKKEYNTDSYIIDIFID